MSSLEVVPQVPVVSPVSPEVLSLSERAKRFTRALSAHEVADLLNISRVSVLRLAKQGSIPSFRVGNLVRFDPRALHDWLRKRAAV